VDWTCGERGGRRITAGRGRRCPEYGGKEEGKTVMGGLREERSRRELSNGSSSQRE